MDRICSCIVLLMEERARKLAFAKTMRQAPVVTERLLWNLLRDRRLGGLKIRRQVPLGRYIVDFMCPRHRLVIEADGPSHEGSLHDRQRDAWLRSQGFRVMRFPNKEIQDYPDVVLSRILQACGADPSPLAGEGGLAERGRVRG